MVTPMLHGWDGGAGGEATLPSLLLAETPSLGEEFLLAVSKLALISMPEFLLALLHSLAYPTTRFNHHKPRKPGLKLSAPNHSSLQPEYPLEMTKQPHRERKTYNE